MNYCIKELKFLFIHRFTECYGKIGLLDWLHKTDSTFNKTLCGLRDFIILDFKSTREVIPDINENDSKKSKNL
jgi:fatty acid hydroxylase domain-containing protein 2